MFAEHRYDPRRLTRDRTLMTGAVDQHGVEFVVAAGKVRELQLHRCRSLITLQLNLGAAVKVLAISDDGEQPVRGARLDPGANPHGCWRHRLSRRNREPQRL